MDTYDQSWYAAARRVVSLGSQVDRPGSLAGLHSARAEHQGQFFTPDVVAALLWRIVTPAMDAALAATPGARISLFDNSVGSGRLFQFAAPDKHELAGCDPHGPSVAAFTAAAEETGFHVDIHTAGMEQLRAHGFNVALINPPFSLHLESPMLEDLPATSMGAYGPHSSALSHVYALDQALAACEVVLAVLPTTYAATLGDAGGRLRAILRLPAGSFREEGTEVDVAVAVFGPSDRRPVARLRMASLVDPLPDFALRCTTTVNRSPRLRIMGLAADEPAVTLPVTGDARVDVAHDGRKLRFRFHCGLVQAKVMNALLWRRLGAKRPDDGRYPPGVRFAGQGFCDLELYLAQPDPLEAFDATLEQIQAAGGRPVDDPGIRGYLRRRRRRNRRQATPYRRVAWSRLDHSGTVIAIAKRHVQCNPKHWGSAVFRKGETVSFTDDGGTYRAVHPVTGEVLALEGKAFEAAFTIEGSEATEGWRVIHEGRAVAFPHLAACVRERLRQCGVERITDWEYQVDDLVELRMAPHGVVGWTMGLGKTRAALALCLSGGDCNLIVVEARLVGELLEQIGEVGLPASSWQVIERPEQCSGLRKVNIISYSRLRMPVCARAGRRTYARLLRRRIHTLVADEAHLLRSADTAQTAAIRMLSPKCRFCMTGTPVANYPRDLLPLIRYVGGDGTAVQPYGDHRPYLEPNLLRDMTLAERGVDVFRRRHVVTEWVTHTFEDNITRGAKREVPKVTELGLLRKWAAPFVLRRVATEPAVAKYVKTPPFGTKHHEVDWDQAHLRYFLGVADQFAEWYREMRKRAGLGGGQVNLIALLARIGAVLMAGNYPQHGVKGFPYKGGLTSKQRFVVARAVELTDGGHKTVVFVENPGLAQLLAGQLAMRGVDALDLTGLTGITERNERLARFRNSDVPVLCATYGVGGAGLNLPEADRAIFATRTWTTKTENQARYRLLRPQQTRKVVFETVELPGSLDTYQAMMLEFKNDATNAAVDYLEPQLDEAEFLHLDAVIDQFVADLAERTGRTPQEIRSCAYG